MTTQCKSCDFFVNVGVGLIVDDTLMIAANCHIWTDRYIWWNEITNVTILNKIQIFFSKLFFQIRGKIRKSIFFFKYFTFPFSFLIFHFLNSYSTFVWNKILNIIFTFTKVWFCFISIETQCFNLVKSGLKCRLPAYEYIHSTNSATYYASLLKSFENMFSVVFCNLLFEFRTI